MAAPVESRHGGANVRVPPPLVFLVSMGAGVGLHWIVAPPPLPFSRAVGLAIGAALVAVALGLIAWAFGLFKKSGQDPAPWKPVPSLLFDGPYRFTRNPMYVGMTTLQMGLGFLLGNLWVLLLAVASLMVVHYTAVLREEAFLDAKFGDDYRAFKRRVRRYL